MAAVDTTNATTLSSAAVQVFTNRALVRHAAAFIVGAPYCVLQLQEVAFQTYTDQRNREDKAWRHDRLPESVSYVSASCTPLWKLAMVQTNRPVITALNELSKLPRYSWNRHVHFDGAMMHALEHSSNVVFLDWLFTTVRRPRDTLHDYRMVVEEHCLAKVVERQDLAVLQWLHTRGYTFTTRMLDVACLTGNLALVRFLLDDYQVECSLQAMDNAAAAGKLNIVRYLHDHPLSPGCTRAAQSRALVNGHLDVLAYLHEHRSEGCSAFALERAVKLGHLACVQFAHKHNFAGFSYCTMSYAITYNQLEIAAFLHTRRMEGCTLESLFSAADCGYDAVVDYLVHNRPVSNRKAVIQAALDRGLVRLALKLALAPGSSAGVQFEYWYS